MTHLPPASRDDLKDFFAVKSRGLGRVLRDLKLRPIGGKLQWGLVWEALGLSPEQDPSSFADLTKPLWNAAKVAEYCDTSTSILYRWQKGQCPKNMPPMPKAIDISNGRERAKGLRWRGPEIVAWQHQRPLPQYRLSKPRFGAITPKT